MPLAGHDRPYGDIWINLPSFLLPCPSRGMTTLRQALLFRRTISTPMPLAGHDRNQSIWTADNKISTPMPLAGHDIIPHLNGLRIQKISTPMPLAGHDRPYGDIWINLPSFLLPCPSRGMTTLRQALLFRRTISTPMPLAGHDRNQSIWTADNKISTPMPLAGHDIIPHLNGLRIQKISTPMPLAGHDASGFWDGLGDYISTPMPLAGHDEINKFYPS